MPLSALASQGHHARRPIALGHAASNSDNSEGDSQAMRVKYIWLTKSSLERSPVICQKTSFDIIVLTGIGLC